MTITSRQGRPLGRYLPEIAAAAQAALPRGAVLDGELVIWTDGRLDFAALQRRIAPGAVRVAALTRTLPASYVAFDLLHDGHQDLKRRRYTDRRAAFEQLLSAVGPPLQVVPMTTDHAEALDWFQR